eukprot:scaffold4823_cov355-Prasinococcus_capsulatus_cf.AAC.2
MASTLQASCLVAPTTASFSNSGRRALQAPRSVPRSVRLASNPSKVLRHAERVAVKVQVSPRAVLGLFQGEAKPRPFPQRAQSRGGRRRLRPCRVCEPLANSRSPHPQVQRLRQKLAQPARSQRRSSLTPARSGVTLFAPSPRPTRRAASRPLLRLPTALLTLPTATTWATFSSSPLLQAASRPSAQPRRELLLTSLATTTSTRTTPASESRAGAQLSSRLPLSSHTVMWASGWATESSQTRTATLPRLTRASATRRMPRATCASFSTTLPFHTSLSQALSPRRS